MKRTLILCFTLIATAFAAEGSFLGQIINGPNPHDSRKWVYVQGPHGASRRVDISAAKVFFNTSVAKKDRESKAENAIREGAKVRVTASQDDNGEWKASAVEIVKAARTNE